MGPWCQHRNQTTPRRDEEGEYRRCVECGKRIPWAWPSGGMARATRMVEPPRTATLLQALTAAWRTVRKSA